jgi:hypothetical protein
MENTYNWLESKKREWKKSIEEAKELIEVDVRVLDTMSALLDGIKIRERGIKTEKS